MNEAQNTKKVIMVLPQAIGTDSVTGQVDCKGWDYCTIDVIGQTAAAGDVMTTLKIGQGDTTSAFTDISGAVGGTDFTIPAPNTSTGDIISFEVDTKTKKRYLQLTMVGDATTRLTAVTATLSRGEQPATSASGRGLKTLVQV